MILTITEISKENQASRSVKIVNKARFSRHSTHVPNLTHELSTAKERRLNQFGTAVLVWCGKSVKLDRVCRTFVELNLCSTHGTPSESDVTPVSLQSRTYSARFGTWKVRRLNQASLITLLCPITPSAANLGAFTHHADTENLFATLLYCCFKARSLHWIFP